MYSIVIFKEEEESCEGVPSSWIINVCDQTYCLWPSVSIGKISHLIKRNVAPSTTWRTISCTVKSTAASYHEMIQKRKEAQKFTTTEAASEEEEEEVFSNVELKDIQTCRIIESSCSEDDFPPPPPPKKKKLITNGKFSLTNS